ncbi:MAG: hypothetical protein AB1631_00815 [Acidobacteriota bacterium]
MANKMIEKKPSRRKPHRAIASEEDLLRGYKPRTALGRKLLELRRRIVAEGTALLTAQGVAREVRKRRGY